MLPGVMESILYVTCPFPIVLSSLSGAQNIVVNVIYKQIHKVTNYNVYFKII